uniref:Uncharacterized protein n=1 Tax=Chromera velia CCMP2878 TaxID=1169474 RepID=A0A0G4HMU9_9ALVE|eukprot:Cvel_29285.t1-p1 / transcript=Cvel_29285.t1 / gene=Cvel_29285 / organism=Chromera_velia_CCMP2878 / gene_product=Autophagy-related protein 18a, putative / transcript_product=Autophagy-related protein 18a, putative / location=Cvel_scaffold3978:7284-12262(+) / protein_length=430 / sequence_SO=supercontig / SO=protein_coding / is_pseudo=false
MSSLTLYDNKKNEFLFLTFNQDYGCFACGTLNGFRVYNSDPFRETFRREFSKPDPDASADASGSTNPFASGAGGGGGNAVSRSQGIGIVEMLYRCNILALVGGGPNPKWAPNKVLLWDDRQERPIAELSFKLAVRAVKLSREVVVVAVETKLYLYRFRDLVLLDDIETVANPQGICAVASLKNGRVCLACPAMQKGRVLVIFYKNFNQQAGGGNQPEGEEPNGGAGGQGGGLDEADGPTRESMTIIAAHEHSLACLALSVDGRRLATASERGTLIRIFDTSLAQQLQEVRRGTEKVSITSIAFDKSVSWLAATSDKGTIHVWTVRQEGQTGGGPMAPAPVAQPTAATSEALAESGSAKRNPQYNLAGLGGLLPSYFSSEFTFAQYRIPFGRCLVAFGGEEHSVLAICEDGSYHKLRFDPTKGGDMTRVSK